MAEANRGWNRYRNDSKLNADGEYGVWEYGVRNPDTHAIIFSGKSADGEPPKETAQEHLANLATPAAQERAAEVGVDVSSISGSGKGGKVTASDVEKAAQS